MEIVILFILFDLHKIYLYVVVISSHKPEIKWEKFNTRIKWWKIIANKKTFLFGTVQKWWIVKFRFHWPPPNSIKFNFNFSPPPPQKCVTSCTNNPFSFTLHIFKSKWNRKIVKRMKIREKKLNKFVTIYFACFLE